MAKSTGAGHLLYPPGVSVAQISAELENAIEHALRILSWQENLSSDEMPPAWMWALDWELELHFNEVERKREAKYGSSGSSGSDEDQSDSSWEENEHTARFRS